MPNRGLIRVDTGRAEVQGIPIPSIRPTYILVRVVAIALNPTDWTTLDAPGEKGTLVGCDYAGIIEDIGSEVTVPFKVGDRVAGFAHGGNDADPQLGAFAEYILVKGNFALKIPDGVSFEEACTIGVASLCSGFALYHELGLRLPDDGSIGTVEPILIYGGSTATGSIAIQLAKRSGYEVLTTCSPKHFDMMQSRGASKIFDYRDPQAGSKIREATNGKLGLIFDTVNVPSSVEICSEAFGDSGGVYCNLLDAPSPRRDVVSKFFLGYSMSGEAYIFECEHYAANPGDFTFASSFARIFEKLWANHGVTTHPTRIMDGGLESIPQGLQVMREGKVSGEKLVYRIGQVGLVGL